MYRIVTLILIPMLLAGQGLRAPHAHCPDVDPTSIHASRPHFHFGGSLGGHRHGEHTCGHDHAHEAEEPDEALRGTDHDGDEHDSDAVLFPESDFLSAGRMLKTELTGDMPICIESSVGLRVRTEGSVCRVLSLPPPLAAGPPLYLRILSIRC